MIELIKADLALLGIHHDLFSSEAELQAAGKPEAAEAWLRERDLVYDGVLEAPKGETPEDWEPVELPLFRATRFGDDQDRPISKSDGSWTYFGADLAYHFQKAQAADQLIDIWGADHAGTVKRIKAAVAALTEGKTPFDVKLVQMVRLLRAGEPVKMSKRSGNFVTLADVVNEVGKDVVRFTMLTRKADAQMDFDFAKVVEASKDNPVFYVQYAHARDPLAAAQGGGGGDGSCRSRPTCRCSTRTSWRWSSSPRNSRASSRARRRRTSRTASLSISATSPPRSTPSGTRVMTTPKSVSFWATVPI